ncbi:MAG: toll/interleukin-1 receptor domain-containing protein [Anaerolineales bacterium]|nr:toll/interleukin-1 receptor domain-containing protein [Anaerolineales bacterium]
MSDIFICYARKDLKISEKIHQALAEFGIAVWVDWEDIPKAEDFLQKTFRFSFCYA